MRPLSIRTTLVVFSILGRVGHAQPAPDAPTGTISTEIVLKVGSVEVSRYAVEKNLTRFLRAGNGQGAPASDATRRWFETYLAHQVVIAAALEQGYAQRPEVVQMVDRMERHMLAQSEPAIIPPTEAELQAAYEGIPLPPDGHKPAFSDMRPGLEKRLLLRRRIAARQALRLHALAAVDLVIAHDVADRLFQLIRAEPALGPEIAESSIAPLGGERLATYRLGDEIVTLRVEDWRERFNQLFIRELPRSVAQVEQSVQDFAAADYTVRDARRRRLDREPRFVEDRRNFVYAQALDLFEK